MNARIEILSEYEHVVKNSDIPVIVIIIANWCGTCQIMAPIFDKLADKYEGKIKFVMADIDSADKVAKDYESEKLPIILFFKQRVLVDQLAGTMSYNVLEMRIKDMF